MGKVSRATSIRMATALQQAVAMYLLLVDHAKGETDLTEDQLEAVVEGVCADAARALSEARRCGLVAPAPIGRGCVRTHRHPAPGPHDAVH